MYNSLENHMVLYQTFQTNPRIFQNEKIYKLVDIFEIQEDIITVLNYI